MSHGTNFRQLKVFGLFGTRGQWECPGILKFSWKLDFLVEKASFSFRRILIASLLTGLLKTFHLYCFEFVTFHPFINCFTTLDFTLSRNIRDFQLALISKFTNENDYKFRVVSLLKL